MEEVKKAKLSKRIIEIDLIRGISVFFMMLDHTMYDIFGLLPTAFRDFGKTGWSKDLYELAVNYWFWDVRTIVRYFIVFGFLGITGICCSFSKSNIKRGLKLMGVSLLLTLGTFIAGKVVGEPDMTIAFGVLHCIALSLILIGLMDKVIPFKWCWIYLALGVDRFACVVALGGEDLQQTPDAVLTVLRTVQKITSRGLYVVFVTFKGNVAQRYLSCAVSISGTLYVYFEIYKII